MVQVMLLVIPTIKLYTRHIVKSIVVKCNVDEPCATSRSGVVEGKFDYEFASRKPCSKS
jgi:hypothetical protein